jgi:segregation and condensation protein A
MEFGYEEDPREELIEKLMEYKKYKEAAGDLKALEQERGLMFTKPPSDLSNYSKEEETDKRHLDVSLYDMLGAFQKLLRRKRLQKPLSTKIARQEIPIEKRMDEIMVKLRKVVTFLSILELMKRKEIFVEQESNFSEIFVIAKGV